MKALTLTQPWAELVIAGTKRYETRGWHTDYRGLLAVHAAKGQPQDAAEFAMYLFGRKVLEHAYQPRGVILGTVNLIGCIRTENFHTSGLEAELGDYTEGRWAWALSNPVRFDEPVPAKGALGIWEWGGDAREYAALAGAGPEEADRG